MGQWQADTRRYGYPLARHQAWCCDAWCYVDPTKCDANKSGIDMKPSWTGKSLMYSYGACADWCGIVTVCVWRLLCVA